MMEILKQLPHLEPYGDPQYFVYIILAVLPIFIGLFFKRRFPIYETLVRLAFIIFMFVGPDLTQLYAFAFFGLYVADVVAADRHLRAKALRVVGVNRPLRR